MNNLAVHRGALWALSAYFCALFKSDMDAMTASGPTDGRLRRSNMCTPKIGIKLRLFATDSPVFQATLNLFRGPGHVRFDNANP